MGEFSLTHLLLLAVIILIFFGPSRLPQLGQSIGKAIKGFKQGLTEIDVEAKDIHDTATGPVKRTEANAQLDKTAAEAQAAQKAKQSQDV
jgi:sec-independent protein translocase protein TatA